MGGRIFGTVWERVRKIPNRIVQRCGLLKPFRLPQQSFYGRFLVVLLPQRCSLNTSVDKEYLKSIMMPVTRPVDAQELREHLLPNFRDLADVLPGRLRPHSLYRSARHFARTHLEVKSLFCDYLNIRSMVDLRGGQEMSHTDFEYASRLLISRFFSLRGRNEVIRRRLQQHGDAAYNAIEATLIPKASVASPQINLDETERMQSFLFDVIDRANLDPSLSQPDLKGRGSVSPQTADTRKTKLTYEGSLSDKGSQAETRRSTVTGAFLNAKADSPAGADFASRKSADATAVTTLVPASSSEASVSSQDNVATNRDEMPSETKKRCDSDREAAFFIRTATLDDTTAASLQTPALSAAKRSTSAPSGAENVEATLDRSIAMGNLIKLGTVAALERQGRALYIVDFLDTPTARHRIHEEVFSPSHLWGLPWIIGGKMVDKMLGGNNAVFYFNQYITGTHSLLECYKEMLTNCGTSICRILNVCLGAEVPILLHCTLGKDRTGLISMLLLHIFGADDDAIATDYARTELASLGFKKFNKWYITRYSGLPEAFCSADIEIAFSTLRMMRERWGSIDGYLDGIGFTADKRERLRSRFLLDYSGGSAEAVPSKLDAPKLSSALSLAKNLTESLGSTAAAE